MQYNALILLSLISGNVLANVLPLDKRATCNADNCARLVTGTATNTKSPSRASRAADCISFLATTVAPPAIITTTTITVTPGQATVNQPSVTSGTASTITPTRVPSYVGTTCGTGAASTSRYSSACSCFPGVTSTVTTLSASTTTSTVYSVSTPATPTCYHVTSTSVRRAGEQDLDATIKIDRSGTTSQCASGGYPVLSISGTSYSIQIQDTNTDFHNADNCFFPDGPTIVDSNGISFLVGQFATNFNFQGTSYNLYETDNDPQTITLTPLDSC